MRPTIGKSDVRTNAVWSNQPIISGIAIHLKDARKPLQYPFGVMPAATGCGGECQTGRRTSAPRRALQFGDQGVEHTAQLTVFLAVVQSKSEASHSRQRVLGNKIGVWHLSLPRSRVVSTGRDRDDERRDFSGFSLRPTKWQSSVLPVRTAPQLANAQRYLINMAKNQRNGRMATAVVPLSLRARRPVSMPLPGAR